MNSNTAEKEKDDDVVTLEIGPKMSVQTYPVIFSKKDTGLDIASESIQERDCREITDEKSPIRNKTADA